jgi:uncharacterized alkaline shock family protein YloU
VTEPDNTPHSPNGTGGGRPQRPAMSFFPPGPAQPAPGQVPPARGQSVSGSRPVIPLGAPVAAGPGMAGRHSTAGEVTTVEVSGQIKIEDTVIEKIATLAALEVQGAVSLGDLGIATTGTRTSLKLHVVVAYGSVVMEVARQVQSNVARIVGLMLGMEVGTVDVTITDVIMPDSAM